jgi:hypothetical protein
LHHALAESLGKLNASIKVAWLNETECKLTAYDCGEIAARKGGPKKSVA